MADELHAERWPVDYDSLRKGDVIEPARIALLVGERPRTHAYQYKIIRLAKQIERALWDRGKPWTVRARRAGIVILTDAQASDYNAEMIDRRRRQMFVSHRKMMAVDVAQLTNEQARNHDKNLLRGGVQVAALAAARKQITPQAFQRKHPVLVEIQRTGEESRGKDGKGVDWLPLPG